MADRVSRIDVIFRRFSRSTGNIQNQALMRNRKCFFVLSNGLRTNILPSQKDNRMRSNQFTVGEIKSIAKGVPSAFRKALKEWGKVLDESDDSEYVLFCKPSTKAIHFDLSFAKGNSEVIRQMEAYCEQNKLEVIGYFSQFEMGEMDEVDIADKIVDHLY
jgi:hypothetical protein